MTPAASRAFLRLLAGETLHVGSGPRGKTVRRDTAKELVSGGHADWTDYDNRGDRPDFDTVSDVRLYLPQCDACHARVEPRLLQRHEDDTTRCQQCSASATDSQSTVE